MAKRQKIRRIPIDVFRDEGYLLEANRRFFHPLGLALEVEETKGIRDRLRRAWRALFGPSWQIGPGVWDYRDDPEGMLFSFLDEDDLRKIQRVRTLETMRRRARVARCGFFVQPAMLHRLNEARDLVDPVSEQTFTLDRSEDEDFVPLAVNGLFGIPEKLFPEDLGIPDPKEEG